MKHYRPTDPKLMNFIAMSKQAGHTNVRLLTEWFRSQRKLFRWFLPVEDFIEKYRREHR